MLFRSRNFAFGLDIWVLLMGSVKAITSHNISIYDIFVIRDFQVYLADFYLGGFLAGIPPFC